MNVPEALKGKIDAEALTKDEGFKGFLGKLHAAGASQKVVDAAVATMLERGVAMREAMPALGAAECEAQLRQQDGWKSDQEYMSQVRLAYSAGKQIFGKDFDGILQDYGNDPRLIRGMAEIGREMEEDRGPSPEALTQLGANLDQLMNSPAYTDPNHKDHANTVAKVTALQAQITGNRPVASGKTMTFKSA